MRACPAHFVHSCNVTPPNKRGFRPPLTVVAPLQAVHGRIVELRRHTNVHLFGRRPLGPTDRYELWIKQRDGVERKFTVNTRNMPARRGHHVSLIVTAHKVPQVLGRDVNGRNNRYDLNGCKWVYYWRR